MPYDLGDPDLDARLRSLVADAVAGDPEDPTDDRLVGEILGRLDIARTEMEEAPTLFDHLITNDDVARATEQIANLIIDSR